MKHLSFFLLLTCSSSLSPAATLAVNLRVRENLAPSRHASFSVSDGTNSLLVDLYRSAFPGEITQLGFCRKPSPLCTFTPGGDLNATNISGIGDPFSSLVLGGVPVPFSNWTDYAITFSMDFTGGSPITVPVDTPWGPQALDADLTIAIVQQSTGICVFCAHAPSGTGTASGETRYTVSWLDYRFNYQASGEIVPESGSAELALVGIAALLATRTVVRRFHRARHGIRA